MTSTTAPSTSTSAKRPFASDELLRRLAQEVPTPFYLYDAAGIARQTEALIGAFSWNTRYREYFAVKACPNPVIMRIMCDRGCGLDCSSATELMLARELGLSGDKIMFSSNDTPAADYQLALELGATINLDAYEHIAFLDNILEEDGRPWPEVMSLRYNPGGIFSLGTSHEGFQVMDNPGEAKFGMTREQLFAAAHDLAARGVKRLGLHSFVASNTLSNDYYPTLARMMFELAVELQAQVDIQLDFINLSGGVGIAYRPSDIPNDIAAIGAGVKAAFEEIMVPAGLDNCAVVTELGRFMTGPFGELITRVLHIKHSHKTYAGVDANACNLLRPAMYKAYHHISVVGKSEGAPDAPGVRAIPTVPAASTEPYIPTHTYDVVGNLCENNDKFAIDRELPELAVGDLLVIHDAGAHGFAMGYNYNGRLRCAEYLLEEDGQVRMIRRAETPEDYFATLRF